MLLRCFHLHPLMVKPQGPLAEFKSTIDDDLALRACPDSSRDYVVTDWMSYWHQSICSQLTRRIDTGMGDEECRLVVERQQR